MLTIILRIVTANNVRKIELTPGKAIIVEEGAIYSIVSAYRNEKDTAKDWQKEDPLLITTEGKIVASLEDFFSDGQLLSYKYDGPCSSCQLPIPPELEASDIWDIYTPTKIKPYGITTESILTLGAGTWATISAPLTTSEDVIDNMVLKGSVIGSPMSDPSGLTVHAYDANGNLLSTAAVDNNGQYQLKIRADFTGPILIQTYDNTADSDFIDEASGSAKDLTTDLRSVVNIGSPDIHKVNITPLTEIATRKLNLASGDNGNSLVNLNGITSDQINSANSSVSKAFGLDNILSDSIFSTIDETGSPNIDANDYGKALAAISGMQIDGLSLNEVLDYITNGLTNGELTTG